MMDGMNGRSFHSLSMTWEGHAWEGTSGVWQQCE